MEPIIWYILIVNGLVLVGQVLISVVLFYFSYRTGKLIQKAIHDVDKRLQDKKMLAEITKRLQKQFANRMGQFSKKMELIKTEAGIEDGGLISLAVDAWTNEEGIIDWAMKNKGRLKAGMETLHKEPEPPVEQDTAPDWWSEDDDNAVQDAINKVVEDRKKAHGET